MWNDHLHARVARSLAAVEVLAHLLTLTVRDRIESGSLIDGVHLEVGQVFRVLCRVSAMRRLACIISGLVVPTD